MLKLYFDILLFCLLVICVKYLPVDSSPDVYITDMLRLTLLNLAATSYVIYKHLHQMISTLVVSLQTIMSSISILTILFLTPQNSFVFVFCAIYIVQCIIHFFFLCTAPMQPILVRKNSDDRERTLDV